MASVIWIEPSPPVGVGAYTGYDKLDNNALAQEIIGRRGAVDEESLKAYGKVGGTIAGAGLCAPGGPVASVGCGIIGGIVGEWIASKIPVAHGSDIKDVVSKGLDKIKPRAKRSANAMYSVRAYLTMRDLAITKGLATDASLTAAGCPPAPVDKRWAPKQSRYDAAKENYAKAGSSDWDYIKKTECGAAKDMGILKGNFTCQDYIYATRYEGYIGPVANADEPIDWYAVGRDEIAFYTYKTKASCEEWIRGPKWVGTPTALFPVPLDPQLTCPTNAPTTLAKAYLTKLNSFVKWPKGPLVPGVPDLAKTLFGGAHKPSKGPSPVLVIGGLVVAGAVAWAVLA